MVLMYKIQNFTFTNYINLNFSYINKYCEIIYQFTNMNAYCQIQLLKYVS